MKLEFKVILNKKVKMNVSNLSTHRPSLLQVKN